MLIRTMAAALPLTLVMAVGAAEVQASIPAAHGLRQAFLMASDCANLRMLHAVSVADGTHEPGQLFPPGSPDHCAHLAELASVDDGADDLGWAHRLLDRLESIAEREPPVSVGQVGQAAEQLAGHLGSLFQ